MKKSSQLLLVGLLSVVSASLTGCGDTPQTGFLLGVGPCVSLVKTRNFCQTIPTASAQAALDSCQTHYNGVLSRCASSIAAAANCAEKRTCAELANGQACAAENQLMLDTCGGDVTAPPDTGGATDGNTTLDANQTTATAGN